MQIAALIIAFALAAQVGPAGGRYSDTEIVPAGDASAPSSPPAGEAPAGAALKRIEPPPGVRRSSVAPPPAGGNESITPLSEGATGLPAASDAPSPYRPLQPPTAATTQGATMPKPSAMMKKMMEAPPGSQLTGNPTRLLDVIAGARTRHEQAHRIEAYWDLCSSVADYYLGVLEQDQLRKLQQLLPGAGATLQQAQAEFDVRLGTSRLGAVASQRRLASMMVAGSTNLPLPGDLPHCGSYQTRYQEIFAERPSVEAQELAALLTSRYAELKDAAIAVTRAKASIGEIAQNDRGQGMETLRALELLALRRRAFVQIARDYNRRIARYTELSTPGEIGAERLVGMLIKVSATPTARRPTPPPSTNGRQSGNINALPPRTFAGNEGWESVDASASRDATRDESVTQASAEERSMPRKERSLLVTPR